jgi:hypothetical protein
MYRYVTDHPLYYVPLCNSILRVRRAQDTAERHLPGLIGTASHPDVQEIRIIGFFFENGNIGILKW